jgi:hypothetical protein
MPTPNIERCSIQIAYESTSGYMSNETFAGDGHAKMLDAFRELGRVLTIAGHGVAMLETATEVKAAVQRDIGNNG